MPDGVYTPLVPFMFISFSPGNTGGGQMFWMKVVCSSSLFTGLIFIYLGTGRDRDFIIDCCC